MNKYNFTLTDIERAEKYSKNFLFGFIFLLALVTISAVIFDNNMPWKDRLIGVVINSSVLILCSFAGESFRRNYFRKKMGKLQNDEVVINPISKSASLAIIIGSILILILYLFEIISTTVFIILGATLGIAVHLLLKSKTVKK